MNLANSNTGSCSYCSTSTNTNINPNPYILNSTSSNPITNSNLITNSGLNSSILTPMSISLGDITKPYITIASNTVSQYNRNSETNIVSDGLLKSLDLIAESKIFLLNELESIFLIKNKFLLNLELPFSVSDINHFTLLSCVFERRVSAEFLLNSKFMEILPKELKLSFIKLSILLQPYKTEELRQILKANPDFKLKICISTQKISESFFESMLKEESEKNKEILINTFCYSNKTTDKFVKNYKKYIELGSISNQKRNLFTDELKYILFNSIKNKRIKIFPKTAIKNLKIPTNELNSLIELVEKRVKEKTLKGILFNEIADAILYSREFFPIKKNIIEETSFIEDSKRNFTYLYKKAGEKKSNFLSNEILSYPLSTTNSILENNFSFSKTYSEILNSLRETGLKENELPLNPLIYISSSENIFGIVRRVFEIKNEYQENSNFLEYISDFQQEFGELPEEFFIEFFENFISKTGTLYVNNLNLTTTTSTSLGVTINKDLTKKVCYIKNYIDIEKPECAELKLMYDLRKSEEGFLEGFLEPTLNF